MYSERKLCLLILIPFFFFFSACNGNDEETNQDADRRSPTVEVARAEYGSLPMEERLTGVVRARNQTEIYPEINAPIVEVLVNNGDRVTRGQPLVRLRDTEFRERLRQAESGYQIAEAQERQAQTALNQLEVRLNRVTRLAERALESQVELENIQAEVESARANLQLARAQKSQAEAIVEERRAALENTVIKAPIDGIVGLRNAEVGQQVSSNTRLFEIGDTDHMRIQVILTERMTGYIHQGQTTHLFSNAMRDTVIEASITRISPFLNPVTHTTQAEIEVSNQGGLLRPGMFVTVDILYGESEKATLVPNNAIYSHPRQGIQGVYLADGLDREFLLEGVGEDRGSSLYGPVPISFVPVEVVANGRMVSGVRGITSGDWVVTVGHNLLVGGHQQALVRATTWDRIMDLQQLHARDIFRIIDEKMNSRSSRDTESQITRTEPDTGG